MPGPAPTSPIRVDPSDSEFLIVCPDHCWHAFRFLEHEAWEAAVRHEKLMHPGDHRIRDAVRATRRKRVAKPAPALSPEVGLIV